MSSALDIQIVSHPNLEKIENFFKDASYRETIEFSANFNTRLGLERRLRLPFLDPQTGVAQNHSQLFMDKKQRMPGFRQGQIYTYPAARWRKSRRQYLNKMYRFPERPFQALRKEHETLSTNSVMPAAAVQALNFHATPTMSVANSCLDMEFSMALQDDSTSLGAIGGDTSDSKDSQQQHYQHYQPQQQQQQQQQHQQQQQQQHHQHLLQQKDELPKEWFYDDMDMQDMDSLEDPKSPADDEYDYDPRYGTKKRRKRATTRRRNAGEGGGSGRRRPRNRNESSLDASMESMDATFGSDGSFSSANKSSVRRPRGSGTRGRRRTKHIAPNATGDPPSPGMRAEPPSFESVQAAICDGEQGDLRNYRKYL